MENSNEREYRRLFSGKGPCRRFFFNQTNILLVVLLCYEAIFHLWKIALSGNRFFRAALAVSPSGSFAECSAVEVSDRANLNHITFHLTGSIVRCNDGRGDLTHVKYSVFRPLSHLMASQWT